MGFNTLFTNPVHSSRDMTQKASMEVSEGEADDGHDSKAFSNT